MKNCLVLKLIIVFEYAYMSHTIRLIIRWRIRRVNVHSHLQSRSLWLKLIVIHLVVVQHLSVCVVGFVRKLIDVNWLIDKSHSFAWTLWYHTIVYHPIGALGKAINLVFKMDCSDVSVALLGAIFKLWGLVSSSNHFLGFCNWVTDCNVCAWWNDLSLWHDIGGVIVLFNGSWDDSAHKVHGLMLLFFTELAVILLIRRLNLIRGRRWMNLFLIFDLLVVGWHNLTQVFDVWTFRNILVVDLGMNFTE